MSMDKDSGVEYQIQQIVTNFNSLLDTIKGAKSGTIDVDNETASVTIISTTQANNLKL